MSVLQTIKSIKQRKNMLSNTQRPSGSRVPHARHHGTYSLNQIHTSITPEHTTYYNLDNQPATVPSNRMGQYIQQQLSESIASNIYFSSSDISENSFDSFDFGGQC